MSENRPPSPLERLLDLAVYGPIGLAMSARDGLPQWVEEGRRQVGARMALARTVGRLAVDQGPRRAGDVARRVADQAEVVLTELGLVPGTGNGTATDPRHVTDYGDDRAEPVPGESAVRPPGPQPGSAPAGDDAAQLAIPGYDTLSASQVVQRLPGLSPDELEAVRLHEVSGRSRKTVLLKVAQLRQSP